MTNNILLGSLHLHFSHSDFDNNICLLNWGNAKPNEIITLHFASVELKWYRKQH